MPPGMCLWQVSRGLFPKRIVEQLFERFDDKIGGAIGKDLKADKKKRSLA
jgi:hypothetical protein